MAQGRIGEYHKIKEMSVFEFWPIFTLWKEKCEREKALLQTKLNRGKH